MFGRSPPRTDVDIVGMRFGTLPHTIVWSGILSGMYQQRLYGVCGAVVRAYVMRTGNSCQFFLKSHGCKVGLSLCWFGPAIYSEIIPLYSGKIYPAVKNYFPPVTLPSVLSAVCIAQN